jgi:hypothetical protein
MLKFKFELNIVILYTDIPIFDRELMFIEGIEVT